MEKKTDLRVLKTHKALCDTFMELCSEKSFEDITIGELCDRALIRRATFYKHFSDKYDFFAFFIRYVQDQFISQFEGQKNKPDPGDQTYDFYTYLFEACSTFIVEHKGMVKSIMNSSAFASLLDIMTAEIQRNIYLHLVESDYAKTSNLKNPELLAYFFSGGVMQLYHYWILNEKTVSKEEIYSAYEELVRKILGES